MSWQNQPPEQILSPKHMPTPQPHVNSLPRLVRRLQPQSKRHQSEPLWQLQLITNVTLDSDVCLLCRHGRPHKQIKSKSSPQPVLRNQ
jgi:hypothetical protein